MNRGLWHKAIDEGRLLLVTCAALMFLFNWIYVWITSRIERPAIAALLEGMAPELQAMLGMDIDLAITTAGRIGMGYLDPIVLLIGAAWAISRGSDVVSGEINRGTMEMLLAQPIPRLSLMWVEVVVCIAGAVLLSVCAWLGTAVGIATVPLDEEVQARIYLAPAINLFAVTLFVAGVSTCASAFDRYRWRTVGLMVGFYVIGMLLEVIGKSVQELSWLRYFTFLAAYEPQDMVSALLRDPVGGWNEVWAMSLRYNGILIGLGVAAYIVAAVAFSRRDLPAPL